MKVFAGTTASLTYTLGKSLYVPLTSRSNSYTLPQTRGPNFLLPSSVVSSLLNVRKIESTDPSSCNEFGNGIEEVETVLLPPPTLPMVPSCPFRNDELLSPSADLLLNEIRGYLNTDGAKSIVFAGEGEPTLRLETLMMMSKTIRNDFGSAHDLTMRIVTNGLVLSHLEERKLVLGNLKNNGVNELSVALMTSCNEQYNDLMKPTSNQLGSKVHPNSHAQICQMIQDAVEVGLMIECTGVDHHFVDKELAEDLAHELGASAFRWRPYFP